MEESGSGSCEGAGEIDEIETGNVKEDPLPHNVSFRNVYSLHRLFPPTNVSTECRGEVGI